MANGEGRRLTRHAGSVAVSLYISRLAIMGRGFVAAGVLGPLGFGLWNALQLIWEYGQYVHLGVLNGLNKEISFRLGRGEREEVDRLKDNGMASMLLTSVGGWMLLLGVLWFRRGELSTLALVGAVVAGAVVVIEEVYLAYVSVLRAYGRISLISRTDILYALVNLGASILLVLEFGLPGLLAGWIATRAGALVYLVGVSGLRFRPRWETGPIVRLLRRGGWVFLYLVTSALLRTVDRVVVLGGLGVESLGYYAIAAAIAGFVAYVPTAVSFVIYPVFLERFGEFGRPEALSEYLRKAMAALSLLIPLLVSFALLLVHIPIYYVLPGYLEALPALRLLLLGAFFGALAPVPVFFLLAIDRDPTVVVLSAAGAGLSLFLGALAVRNGWGLVGVAGAKATADCLYGCSVALYAGVVAEGARRGGVRLLAESLLPGLWIGVGLAVSGIVAGWPDWSPAGPDTGGSLIRLLVTAVSVVPLIWLYERRWGLSLLWRGFISQKENRTSDSE